MAKPIKMDDTGDSDDLQSLFDSIADSAAQLESAPVLQPDASGDSDELQALFDSVAAEVGSRAPAPAAAADAGANSVATTNSKQRRKRF